MVYWQPKSWVDSNIAYSYQEDWLGWTDPRKSSRGNGVKITDVYDVDSPFLPKRCLQQDGLPGQNNDAIFSICRENNVVLSVTPAECTDAVATIDAGIGLFVKRRIAKYYRKDFMSSPERADAWVDGLPLHERRILMTHWAQKAWEDLCARPDFITSLFKRCGMFNDIYMEERTSW